MDEIKKDSRQDIEEHETREWLESLEFFLGQQHVFAIFGQEHAFLAIELALQAQEQAMRIETAG